jgi:hypothetical protein
VYYKWNHIDHTEREEINDEDEIANDLTGDLRRLRIDGDHHPFDIFRESKTDIQTPHSKRTISAQDIFYMEKWKLYF